MLPSQIGAGQSLLYRHLKNESEIDLQVFQTEPSKWGFRKLLRRLLGRLGQIKWLSPFCQDVMVLWRGGWIDAELPAPETANFSTVVMTVAHQEACHAAMRYAHRYGLPLVTFFHDWWPDVPAVHRLFRSLLERSFRQLYSKSSLALCVSPGMKKALGPHENSRVLLPIPAAVAEKSHAFPGEANETFKLLYAGNLAEYGPMLMDALDLLKNHQDIRLEVRGGKPRWPEDFRQEMSERGLFLPFAPIGELDGWFAGADAFLITQSFDEKDKRLMETNFPSKLTEFAKFGKPLIIWGPSYASGACWVKDTGQGISVDQEDPKYLKRVLSELCENTDEQKRFAMTARAASSSCFNPMLIQADFKGWLRDIEQR